VLGFDRNPHSYTEEEVAAAMAKQGRTARVDLGPGQILYRYARSPGGGRATVDDLTGAGAVRTAVYNLWVRQRVHPTRLEPWGYWPGTCYDMRYARKVGRLAAKLRGGDK
jgi:hypothetical protein